MEKVTVKIQNVDARLYEYYGCSLTYDYNNQTVQIQLPNDGLEVFSQTLLHHNHTKYRTYLPHNLVLKNIFVLESPIEFECSRDKTLFKLKQLIQYLVKVKSLKVIDNTILQFKTDSSIVYQIVIFYLKLKQLNITFSLQGNKLVNLNTTVKLKFEDLKKYTQNLEIINNFKEILDIIVGYIAVKGTLGYMVQVPIYKKKVSKQYVIADVLYGYKLLWNLRN